MENPPLWVWAIVVGLIIAGKYAYRWKTTKQLAKEIERRDKGIGLSKDTHSLNHAYLGKLKGNRIFFGKIKTKGLWG
jgi:hypothetical protein